MGTLVDPISTFLQREQDLIIHLALTKFKTELALDEKSSDTQELMDLDPPVDAELVKNLISDAVNKETKKLRAELGQVKKQLRDASVKEERGQGRGASRQKENALKLKSKKKKKDEERAEESNNDINDGKGKKKKTKKSKKKKQTGRK